MASPLQLLRFIAPLALLVLAVVPSACGQQYAVDTEYQPRLYYTFDNSQAQTLVRQLEALPEVQAVHPIYGRLEEEIVVLGGNVEFRGFRLMLYNSDRDDFESVALPVKLASAPEPASVDIDAALQAFAAAVESMPGGTTLFVILDD